MRSPTTMGQQGVSRINTRRQRRRRWVMWVVGILALLGCIAVAAAVTAWIRNGTLRWPHIEFRSIREPGRPIIDTTSGAPVDQSRSGWRMPIVLTMPAPWLPSILGGVLLWVLAVRLLVAPWVRRHRSDPRHHGLARLREIRKAYSARAVRAAGRFTLPGTSWVDRWLLPTTSFGYRIGRPIRPRDRGLLWVDWEQRVRIIARPGWGKTLRLLVPMIRELPGPAVISSIEPEIFYSTVMARKYRARPARFRILRLLPRWRQTRRCPVFVVDFTSPSTRYAAGWPAIRWNPIPGCQDWITANRRASALVSAVETDEAGGGEGTDRFFRESAQAVLASWLHAAAVSGQAEIADMVEWLRDSDVATPRSLLEQAGPVAEPTAVMHLTKHLDARAGRTTSGVERYLSFAIGSMASGDGAALCGKAADPQFSMDKLIRAGGTLYLLAEPERMHIARPLLSLIAEEMFLAAERVARSQPGRTKRLREPFMGVLDELRYGVRVANLPYVASALRKFGVGYVYAVQSAAQEDALYGQAAATELRAAAGTSIYGGIDPASAKDVADRAGQTAVVRATRTSGQSGLSEQVQMLDTFTIGDQQELGDGEALILPRGLAPFLTYTQATYERRRLRRRIDKEATEVNADMVAARARLVADTDYAQKMGLAGSSAPRRIS